MFRLGAHVSISGGLHRAVEREEETGGNCGQIFVGSPRGWKVKQPDEEDAKRFRELAEKKDIKPWIVHSTYLINLATPKEELGNKSLETMQAEIDATSKLGIPYYVFHPGAHTGAGVERGIENVAERLSKLEIHDDVKVLLENTAGKGTTLGQTFGELSRMIDISDCGYEKLGVCLDTCHMYSGGYDFSTEEKLEELLDKLEKNVGLKNVHFLHLNDSKYSFASEKDEHEHIGEGKIGERGFRLFVNHKKLRDKPMVLETPVDERGFAWNISKVKEIRN